MSRHTSESDDISCTESSFLKQISSDFQNLKPYDLEPKRSTSEVDVDSTCSCCNHMFFKIMFYLHPMNNVKNCKKKDFKKHNIFCMFISSQLTVTK